MIVDISHHNKNIDWPELARHIELAIIRSSNGHVTDTRWAE